MHLQSNKRDLILGKVRLARFITTANLVEWAKDEIERAGLFDCDSDYGGEIGHSLLELVKHFADQGHSGASANFTSSILSKLMNFEPISPIKNPIISGEYIEYAHEEFQSNRDPSLFSSDGGESWYRLTSIPVIDVENDGSALDTYVSRGVRTPVHFDENDFEIIEFQPIDWKMIASELWLLLDSISETQDTSIADVRHEYLEFEPSGSDDFAGSLTPVIRNELTA